MPTEETISTPLQAKAPDEGDTYIAYPVALDDGEFYDIGRRVMDHFPPTTETSAHLPCNHTPVKYN